MSRSPRLGPWRASLALGVIALPATAAGACQVRASAGATAWAAVAGKVEQRLSEQGGAGNDCGEVEVLVRPDGSALVRFFTRDGRVAERLVAEPGELGPVVEALVATSPPDRTRVAPPAAPSPPVAAPATELAWRGAAGSRASTPGRKLHWRYLSPALELGLGGAVGPWEVGVVGEWAPLYSDRTKSEAPGFAMSSILFGVQVAHRVDVGPVIARAGFVAGVMQVRAEADAIDGEQAPVADRAQTRAGVRVGALWPARARTRFAVDVRGEGVVGQTGKATPVERALPPLPGFALVLTLGVEGRVL